MPAPVRVAIVAAVAENGVIGHAGGLPWHLSSDLKLFRRLTIGKPIIMGRRTYQAIGRPLDSRDNIVVTRNPGFDAPDILIAADVDAALTMAHELARRRGADEIAVIGGAQIYQAVLPVTDRIYLTRVDAAPEGDTFFPELVARDWHEVDRAVFQAGANDDHDFTFVTLDRRSASRSAKTSVS